MTMLRGSYDLGLVAISTALAIFTAYASLDLAGRVTASSGRAHAAWLAGGAVAMGVGMWSAHYLGMLALILPMPMYYHSPTVLISLLAAIAASAVVLFVVSRPHVTLLQRVWGSVVAGSGIAAMHYIGMDAMRCSAVIIYDRRIVALSIVLAVAGSLVTLIFGFRARNEQGLGRGKISSTLIIGSVLPLIHYTGMWSANFHYSVASPDLRHAAAISTIGLRTPTARMIFSTGDVSTIQG